MWSVCFTCLLVFVIAIENAEAQDYTKFYKRMASLNRPIIISADGSRKYYENPKRDLSSKESQDSAKKINVDVYYETDCPDSMRFITTQLYPVYKEMGDILQIHLHPYGKAYKYYDEDKKKYSFSCHHGPSECYGNSVQACGLKLLSKEDAFNLVNCMEGYPRPSRNAQKCARKLSLDWGKIDKCVSGDMGYNLMNELADKTENLDPNLYFVPWIVFDDVFNQGDFRKAQRDLKSVICGRYKGNHPSCGKQA